MLILTELMATSQLPKLRYIVAMVTAEAFDRWAIPRCRTYISDTYFMPGAPTENENYIMLLLFHTHHLTISCGTF